MHDTVLAEIITEQDRVGNHWADKYAEWGSELIQPEAEQVRTTTHIYAQARYIQPRLAECNLVQYAQMSSCTKAIPPQSDKPPPVRKPTAQQHMARLGV